MDSSAKNEICGICGTRSLILHRNLMKVKTKFSSTTVYQLLERFAARDLSNRIASLVESGACNDCYAKLNDYDAAYTKALIIQQELRNLLQDGSLHIFEDVAERCDEVEHENTHGNNKTKQMKWVPHLEQPGENDLPGEKKPAFSLAGLTTIRVSMQCNVCGAIFNNKHDMDLHSHEEVTEEEKLKMELTRESSTPSPALVIESVKSEPPSAANSDDDADEYTEYIISVVNPKEGEACPEKEEKKDNEEPEPDEKAPVPLECFLCEEKVETKHGLRVHFKTKHPSSAEGHICKVCGITTKTRAALASHYGRHVREPQLTCKLCNKKFSQRTYLQRHMVVHTREKTYQCDMCGKQYLHYSSFYMHQLAHKNIRSKKCTICGYALRSNSHLKRHMRMHSGERPFECPVCGQKFSQKYNMMQHHNSHMGILRRFDKTFACPTCTYVTNRSTLMKKHMLKHHGKEMTASECSKPKVEM